MAGVTNDGEIVYVIRADDSQAEKDLAAFERKAEQSVKKVGQTTEKTEKDVSKTVKKEKEGVTQHHNRENEKRGKSDEEMGKKREKNEQSVSGKIMKIISDTAKQDPVIGKVTEVIGGLSGTAGAWMDVGAAAVAVGGVVVGTATEMDQAMNGYLASTGKGKEETEQYQQVLENIYANNYGESFGEIAEAMAQMDKQLGDMDDESLQSITESAFALRDTFDYDVSESARAAKALIDNFGVDGEKAMGLIAKGAQDGLDFSGEMLDGITEYSEQFAKVGLDADDMFQIMQKGAETGAWNLEAVGDAVEELGIRAIDGSDSTKEGFELIGLNAEEMAEKFAAGGETAKEALEQTMEALAEMEDPLAQNAAGVDLFGATWENLGPEVVAQLAGIGDEAYATAEDMEAIKEVKYDDLGSVMDELRRSLELLLVPLGQSFIPLLTLLAESILPLVSSVLKPIMDLFVAILEPILQLISVALEPLIGLITLLIETAMKPLMDELNLLSSIFTEVLNGIAGTVQLQIDNVTTIFKNLLDFIKNVFTGDWEGAWENIKTIFKTVADSLSGIWKVPINAIIDLINGFINGINEIRIPDWVPSSLGGGKGFDIPNIPRLKAGIDFVPEDYFPAFLDYGERVLTKEENQVYGRIGGLEGIEASLSGGAGKDSDLAKAVQDMTDMIRSKNLVIEKGAFQMTQEIDGKVTGRALAPYIDTEFGESEGEHVRG